MVSLRLLGGVGACGWADWTLGHTSALTAP